jgi:Zn-finger nucleic acid-binding protein
MVIISSRVIIYFPVISGVEAKNMSEKTLRLLIAAYHRNIKNYIQDTNQAKQQSNSKTGVQTQGPTPGANKDKKIIKSPKKCPECHHNFIVILIEGIEVESCMFCQSLWLDRSELASITGLSKDVPGEILKHRKSKHKCPLCQETMNEYLFTQNDNLLVDKCLNGHGVYLESEELKRILDITH